MARKRKKKNRPAPTQGQTHKPTQNPIDQATRQGFQTVGGEADRTTPLPPAEDRPAITVEGEDLRATTSVAESEQRERDYLGENYADRSLDPTLNPEKDGTLEDRMRRLIWTTRRDLASQRQQILREWLLCWEWYNNTQKSVRVRRARGLQIRVAKALEVVESIAPRLFGATMGPRRWMSVEPARSDADQARAFNLETWLYWNFKHANWRTKYRDFLRMIAIFGKADGYVSWCRDVKEVLAPEFSEHPDTRDPHNPTAKDPEMSWKAFGPTEEVYEYAKLHYIWPHDIYADLSCDDYQNAPLGVMHMEQMSEMQVLQGERSGYYKNVDDLYRSLSLGTDDGTHYGHNYGVTGTGGTVSSWDADWWEWGFQEYAELAVGIDNQWGWGGSERSGPADRMFAMMKGQREVPLYGWREPWVEVNWEMAGPVLTHLTVNRQGFRNYFRIDYTKVPDFAMGHGAIKPIKDQLRETNEFTNLRAENAALAVRPPVIIEKSSGISQQRQVWEAGTILDPHSKASIGYVEHPPGFDTGSKELRENDDVIRRVSGLPSVLSGESDPGEQTGTEITTLQTEGNIRHNDQASSIMDGGLGDSVRIAAKLAQARLTKEMSIRVTGRRAAAGELKINQFNIQGEFDFNILGARETEENALKVQQAQNFMQTVLALVQVPPGYIEQVYGVQIRELLFSIAAMQKLYNLEKVMPDERVEPSITGMDEMMMIMAEEDVEVRETDAHEQILMVWNQPIAEPILEPMRVTQYTPQGPGAERMAMPGETPTYIEWFTSPDNERVSTRSRALAQRNYLNRMNMALQRLQQQMQMQQLQGQAGGESAGTPRQEQVRSEEGVEAEAAGESETGDQTSAQSGIPAGVNTQTYGGFQ